MITESKRKLMGLENVKRRLNLLYSNSHGLEMSDKERKRYIL